MRAARCARPLPTPRRPHPTFPSLPDLASLAALLAFVAALAATAATTLSPTATAAFLGAAAVAGAAQAATFSASLLQRDAFAAAGVDAHAAPAWWLVVAVCVALGAQAVAAAGAGAMLRTKRREGDDYETASAATCSPDSSSTGPTTPASLLTAALIASSTFGVALLAIAGTCPRRDAPTPTVPPGADARWLPTALATVGAPTAALPLLAAHGAWQGRAVVVNSFGGAAGASVLLLAAAARAVATHGVPLASVANYDASGRIVALLAAVDAAPGTAKAAVASVLLWQVALAVCAAAYGRGPALRARSVAALAGGREKGAIAVARAAECSAAALAAGRERGVAACAAVAERSAATLAAGRERSAAVVALAAERVAPVAAAAAAAVRGWRSDEEEGATAATDAEAPLLTPPAQPRGTPWDDLPRALVPERSASAMWRADGMS